MKIEKGNNPVVCRLMPESDEEREILEEMIEEEDDMRLEKDENGRYEMCLQ